jgi:hypothetical protein
MELEELAGALTNVPAPEAAQLEAHRIIKRWQARDPKIRAAAVEQQTEGLKVQEAALVAEEKRRDHLSDLLATQRARGVPSTDLVHRHFQSEQACENYEIAIHDIKADIVRQKKPHPETDPVEVIEAHRILGLKHPWIHD